jgi:hypothetical protein
MRTWWEWRFIFTTVTIGTGWRRVVIFMLLPHYPQEKSTIPIVDPRAGHEVVGRKISLLMTGIDYIPTSYYNFLMVGLQVPFNNFVLIILVSDFCIPVLTCRIQISCLRRVTQFPYERQTAYWLLGPPTGDEPNQYDTSDAALTPWRHWLCRGCSGSSCEIVAPDGGRSVWRRLIRARSAFALLIPWLQIHAGNWGSGLQGWELRIATSLYSYMTSSMVWVRERTIPTERPPLVGEVIANFCG